MLTEYLTLVWLAMLISEYKYSEYNSENEKFGQCLYQTVPVAKPARHLVMQMQI